MESSRKSLYKRLYPPEFVYDLESNAKAESFFQWLGGLAWTLFCYSQFKHNHRYHSKIGEMSKNATMLLNFSQKSSTEISKSFLISFI